MSSSPSFNIANAIIENMLLNITNIAGCLDETACNYNSIATETDDSCIYPVENYNCNGNCIAEIDCAGECGGNATEDICGVCNGDNFSCKDCNDEINGEAYIDGCSDCVGGNTGLDPCGNDCIGVPGGTASYDNCGTCDNDPSNDCIQDCDGVWSGSTEFDECGICGGNGLSCLGINGLVTPDNYSISNIYPNPFNPTTNIKYELPENNTVKIVVYDLNGKIIQHLVNEFQTTGIYTVTWKATGNPSGLYFIHMQSGSLYHTRKVVLLK